MTVPKKACSFCLSYRSDGIARRSPEVMTRISPKHQISRVIPPDTTDIKPPMLENARTMQVVSISDLQPSFNLMHLDVECAACL